MTTSNLNQPRLSADPGGLGPGALPAGDVPAGGVLDPTFLARMANEFFSAIPGADPRAASTASSVLPTAAPATLPATIPAGPPEVSLPSDPHFQGVPASAGGATVSPATAPAQVTPPVIPGALGSAATSDQGAGLSFLQEARPIYDGETEPAVPAYPAARPITEFVNEKPASLDDRALLDGLTLPSSVDDVQPPVPAIPGAFSFADTSALPAFSFLEEARPLFSPAPALPGPAPAGVQPTSPDIAVAPLSTVTPASEFGTSLTAPFGFIKEARPIAAPYAEDVHEPAGTEPNVPDQHAISSHSFDAETLKRDFPILRERVNGRPLVWLDNAATTQKPQSVIDRLEYFYQHENSNVHRAAHELAARATDAYESAREKVRRFVNASSAREIIFVRGATEGINLLAQTWGKQNIQKDDEIVITWLEHHANIVPWQMLCSQTGARLRVVPVDSTGQVLLDEYEKLLGSRTRLVSFTLVSNALGTVTPAHEIIEAAHRHGAKVLLDGAQSVSHMRTDVQTLDCDFFVFSGHKVFAPTGIGVVYGKPEILEHMIPWQGGGNMIQDVTFEKTVYQPAPQRFEAGTGNIADAVGLGAAIDYLDRVGMENVSRHEATLLRYATEALQQIPDLQIIGTAREKAGVISFILGGYRTEEVGDYLNRNGIAVRSGHHCAQPILRRFGLESTVRASLALYNTCADIDALVRALWNLKLGHTAIE